MRRRRVARLLGVAGLVLVLLVAAAGAGVVWLIRAGLPVVRGTLEVPGLRAPVTVYRDAYGVPHIVASNPHDLAFAAGYVQAQDRLWQMDLTRRAVTGRLAEIFGAGLVDADKFLLAIGLGRAAQAAWDSPALSADARASLEAFSDGVNAYLAGARRLPLEFILLGYKPEPWTPVHSLGLEKYMAYDLAGNFQAELVRMALVETVGAERARELWPTYPADAPVILDQAEPTRPGGFPGGVPDAGGSGRPDAALVGAPAGVSPAGLPSVGIPPGSAVEAQALLRLVALAEQVDSLIRGGRGTRASGPGDGAPTGTDAGSNNWVIAGRHSASGKPLLANDPHLGIAIPAVWYEIHLVIPGELNVMGVTFPGAPGVVLGTNGHIAWGATNLAADVQDLYLERFDPENPTRYAVEGGWAEAEVVRYEIRVKGQGTVPFEVRWTRHGPVISGVVEGVDVPLALAWTAHTEHGAFEALHRINRARNWEEFREALRHYPGPMQNWVFAAADGTIGYKGAGRVPIRAAGHDGLVPVPGWTAATDWQGTIPFDDLPEIKDPPGGVIVTANNRAVPESYPYHLSDEWSAPHRAETILAELGRLLQTKGALTLDDLALVQNDWYDGHAAQWVPVLLDALDGAELGPAHAAARDQLAAWDFVARAEQAAPLVHHAWFLEFLRATLADELGEELFLRFLEHGGAENVSVRLWETGSAWFDDVRTAELEDFRAIARRAFVTAVDGLVEAYGPNPAGWRWGRAHHITFDHPMGRQKPLDRLLNLGPYPIGGSRTTPGAQSYSLRDPFAVTSSAPWRFLVDLGTREVRAVVAPGNSGVRSSPHYGDLVGRWLRGEYHPLAADPDALAEQPGVRVLRLVPAAGGS